MALGAGLSLILRRIRLDPGPPLTMFVLVGATCFLFAALPRLFDAFSDDGLRAAFSNAPVALRNPRLLGPGRIPAGAAADPLSEVGRRAEQSQHEALPAALDDLVVERSFVVRSPSYVQPANEGLVRYLNLRVPAAGVESRPACRRPAATPDAGTGTRRHQNIPERARTAQVPLLEVALSQTTAHELQLKVGDRLVLQPDREEPDVRHLPQFQQRPVAVVVTGVFGVHDPKDGFWYGDPSVDTPNVEFTANLDMKFVHGQALISPAQYPTLLAATAPLRLAYEYRYLLDGDRSTVDGCPACATPPTAWTPAMPRPGRTSAGWSSVSFPSSTASARHARRRRRCWRSAIGLLVCALANLGLLGVLSFDRRSAETTLSRVRGASSSRRSVATRRGGADRGAGGTRRLGARGARDRRTRGARSGAGWPPRWSSEPSCCSSRRSRASRDARWGRCARGRRPRVAGAWQAGSRGPGRDRRAPGRLSRRRRGLESSALGASGASDRISPRSGPVRAGLRDRRVAPSLSAAGGGPARPADEGSRAPARPQPRRAATGHDLAPGARARRRARDRGVLGSDGEHDPGRRTPRACARSVPR